jgi:hypothetical protein
VEAVTQKFNNELVFDPEAEVGNLSFRIMNAMVA